MLLLWCPIPLRCRLLLVYGTYLAFKMSPFAFAMTQQQVSWPPPPPVPWINYPCCCTGSLQESGESFVISNFKHFLSLHPPFPSAPLWDVILMFYAFNRFAVLKSLPNFDSSVIINRFLWFQIGISRFGFIQHFLVGAGLLLENGNAHCSRKGWQSSLLTLLSPWQIVTNLTFCCLWKLTMIGINTWVVILNVNVSV